MTAPAPRLFVLIPVHNRLRVTRRCLEQLREQRTGNLIVVVVDDGSTDGTAEMLRTFQGLPIEVVNGDGSMWWGGAMEAGMRFIDARASDDDRVLLLNDDVELPSEFLTALEAVAEQFGPDTMIGCAQRDLDGHHPGYIGYSIDYSRQSIRVVLTGERPGRVVDVDALPGRGVLLAVRMLRAIGYIDARRFPHFLGDIEYTARARDFGYRVVCLTDLCLATPFAPSDQKLLASGWRQRLFSPYSSSNLRQRLLFWMRRGPRNLRRTAVLRSGLLESKRVLRRVFGIRSASSMTQ